jgi:hypothetical protein
VDSGGNDGNWVVLDRLGAAEETVEHPPDSKVILGDILARLL